jgi:hypothetical protein
MGEGRLELEIEGVYMGGEKKRNDEKKDRGEEVDNNKTAM